MDKGGSKTFVDILMQLGRDFNIPETLTTDGGPHFISETLKLFLEQYGIRHRLTSVGNPHANSRAEIAVKTAKRLLRENVGVSGKLDTVKVSQALLTYRNTPDRDTDVVGKAAERFPPESTDIS